MHFLAVLSMKNRALIALITIVAAIFGSLALTSLKQELIPSLQLPQLLVSTSYPGASPEVVNDDVSTPIETAIQGIAGLESTSTTSSTNSSLVSATFTYGTDLVKAESRISQAINRIKSRLPDNLDPQVISGSIDDFPVISLAVSGRDQATLADDLKRSVLGDIRDVSGVREAALVGDVGRRVTITADAAALAARGLTTQAIRSALQQNGALIPAGSLTEGDKTLSVQAGGKLTSAADIASLPLLATGTGTGAVAAQGGAPATPPTIGDVATVVLGENPVASISRVNGQPALTIAVTKVPAANTVDVSTAVRAILPKLQDAVPGTTFTVVFDQAPFIQESINSLTQEGILGLVFAVLVILVFLLSVRATLVTAISIPTSVLITFIGLQGVGYSLNILTLGALTIAIGRVVDDSIVVIENIKRHLVPGVDRSETIVAAVHEVAGAITASTITTVTVFLPIAFVGGSTGELFRPFALTVTIALLASLLVSLTIVPVLAYWFLRAPSSKPATTPKSAQPGTIPETAPVLVTTDAAAFASADPTGPGALASESEPATTVAAPTGDAAAYAATRGETAAAPVSAEPDGFDPLPQPQARVAETGAAADRRGESVPAAPTAAAPTPATPTPAAPTPATPTAPAAPAAPASRRTRHAASASAAAIVEEPSRLQTGYLPVIRWTLRHAVVTLLLSVLVLGGTVAIIPFMKVNFLGSTGQTTFRVAQALPVGTSLAAQDAASTTVETALRGTPGVKIVQVSIGGGGSSLAVFAGRAPTTSTVSYSITTDGVAKPDAVQDAVRGKVAALTGVGDFSVTAGGGFGGTSDIAVDITAANGADLQKASDSILAAVKKLDAIKESSSNLAASRPYLAVAIDRTKAAAAGLSELALGTLVSQAMQPSVVGSIVINEANLSVYLTAAGSPTTAAELAALPIPTRAGPVALSTLATVAQVDGPATLTTTKGLRTATVSATPNNNDLGTANARMATVLADTPLPTGATAILGGVTKDQTDAFQQLGIALLAAILIVYVVMVATFRSLLQPLLLLVSIPFAATGAIALQVITGIPLGVPSLIGVLMLIGIVVTNAIVLIDLVNQYRRRGLDVSEALVNGASRRLRPILMTALATIFALLPMAVGLTGTGGFISQPLALVVIGGLVSSTLLTLIVLPVLYFLVEGGRERRAVRREEKNAARAAAAADAGTNLG